MQVYLWRCPAENRVHEVVRPMSACSEPYACPDCGADCRRVFSVAGVRVEDYENIGIERGADHAFEHLGLPDIPVPVGRDPKTGKERFEFRPHTTADIPNRRAFLEAAKRAGLSPGDGGRFRTVGQR